MSCTAAFSFVLPTRIEFGSGIARRVGEEASGLGGARALIVTDPGVLSAGLVEPVVADLDAAGISSVIYSEISPNPRNTQVDAGAAFAASEGVDLLVAVGGGSPMDSAKGIGVILTHGGAIVDYEGLGVVAKPITPLIAIPTTAGTGSEVTFWAVVTDVARSFKMSVGSPLIAASVALVDPDLTVGLPPTLTASTGMDALTHAVEGLTAIVAEPLTDSLAVSAIELVANRLRQAYAYGANAAARHDMMLASLLAGVAFGNSDVGAVHCMGEAIGGLYDTPHGVANAIFLPVVCEYNCIAQPQKYARITAALGVDTCGMTTLEAAKACAPALRELAADVGIPPAAAIIKPEDFPRLAHASAVNVSVEDNARVATEADFARLLQLAYDGS